MGNKSDKFQGPSTTGEISRSPHQVKDHDWLRCLLRAKDVQKREWKKVVISTSYDHVTSYGNRGSNCYSFSLFCYECLCMYILNILAFVSS